MTQQGNVRQVMESVRSQILDAFPDVAYPGPITPADGKTGEDYDEYEAFYGALHGRTWSEIPVAFIQANAYGLVLLTDEAFAVYLPAWLIEGLTNPQVDEALVQTFCPDPAKDTGRMDRRMKHISSPQKDALCAFLANITQTKSSPSARNSAREALAWVRSFCGT